MSASPSLTDDIIGSFLKCRYKAHLKLHRATEESSEYQQLQTRLAAEYRLAARREMLRTRDPAVALISPTSLTEALHCRPALILDVVVDDAGESCRLDALERTPGGAFTLILFSHHQQITADDRVRFAFGASILARVQGLEPQTGRIVHGPQFRSTRVSLPTLTAPLRDAIDQVQAIRDAATPPPLVLNKHCGECEFRQRCRALAVEKNDLSLLSGLSAKELAALNARGIFTVTQYSYTFRPGRMKRANGKKHDHSLQALALRENTVYVAKRPELPAGKSVLYLDVEGLPDKGFHYLIGLTVVVGESRCHFYFWADCESEEASMWASFLETVGAIEDFVLFHYGSYESKFLERMEGRHGGNTVVITRVKERSVNVLSLIYSRVYFPVHSNDLKSVAGCLDFRWSDAAASGLQSIVWRHGWEATRGDQLKQRLLTYNEEDCSALERVVQMLRSLGGEREQSSDGAGLRIAGVEEVASPYRHRFGIPKFALPEFARLTRCAYFDYQRDKVLCRTNPRLKKAGPGKKGRKRKAWKVIREVEWDRLATCPHCGSAGLDTQTKVRKLVIDLKPFRGGLKREVTRHKACRCRCRKCLETFLPPGYLAMSRGYGNVVSAWVVYSSIALRQSNQAASEALGELFGVPLGRGYTSKIRQRAAERYRATYEALLESLRRGPLVHADETRVKIKGPTGDGYVWVFASPDTAVYVYAPTRDGDTARQALAGFKGILVSDFYSAYDSLDCPQQKCLIHLIRDVNDDLLKNPFDEELKQLARNCSDWHRLPVRLRTGKYAGQIRWVPPTLSRVLRVLKNPRYAGVYFYGRTRQKKGVPSGTLPREQWKVFIPNAHPGYISLEEFEANQQRLRQNSVTGRAQGSLTPAREGPALLQGLLVCGRCGRRMSLRYQYRRGRVNPMYYCQRQATEYGGALCQHLPGGCVDQAVSQLVVEALTHEAIEVALAVYEELGRQHEEFAAIHRNRIERARHEADVAERQFLLVNPENRLVADNLERRWNDALRAVAEAEETFAQWGRQHPAPLDPQAGQRVRDLVGDFPAVWDHPRTTARQRKQMLRLLIQDVTLLRQEQIAISVRWKGGATSELCVPVPLNGFEAKRTDPTVLKNIAAWAEQHTDEEIAERLNREGMRTGAGQPFTYETVSRLRREKGIAGLREHLWEAGMRTTKEITEQTGIAESTLRKWREAGYLHAVHCDHKHWLYEFPTPAVLKRIAQAQGQK